MEKRTLELYIQSRDGLKIVNVKSADLGKRRVDVGVGMRFGIRFRKKKKKRYTEKENLRGH